MYQVLNMTNSNELVEIIKQSELEPTKAQYILDNFSGYFALASDWEQKAKAIVITNENQKAEMKMAREGRLFLREKRIELENARKKLKEQSLREGKAIDGIANVLKALIVPIEEYLDKQEKFVEYKEAEKQAQLKLEMEKKLEEERIAKEKADAEERERIAKENIQLKAEAEAREKAMQAEREKADAERRALEAKVKAEAEAREKIEAEQRRKEAEEKLLAQQKEQEIKNAEKAPDIEKLRVYAVEIATVSVPKIKTKEAQEVLDEALTYIKKAVELLKQ
jgi:hypothetical protein